MVKRKRETYTVTARKKGNKTPYSKGTGLTYSEARKTKKLWKRKGSTITIKKG